MGVREEALLHRKRGKWSPKEQGRVAGPLGQGRALQAEGTAWLKA